MARRTLPVAERVTRTPTTDAIRTRLGGRARTLPGVGRLVLVHHAGRSIAGVVLFVSESSCDVWLGDNLVRRVPTAQALPLEGVADASVHAIAADAARFAALSEGSRVRFELRSGAPEEGTLIEKCRFGALIVRADGGIVGVGFRRIAPAPRSGGLAN